MLTNSLQLLRRCYAIAAPYGRRKLAVVMAVIFANGFLQVIGVTSIFPFFALAADPQTVRNSQVGSWAMGYLPEMSERSLLIWAGLASIFLLFFSNAVSLAGEVIRTRYGHGLGHSLRARLMESLAQRPYSYFLERNSGALLQKMVVDVTQFISFIFLPMLEATSRLVTLVFLLFTVFLVQPAIALGAAGSLGVFYLGAFLLLRRRSQRLGQGIKRANTATMIAAQEFLGGIKPIFVHNRAAHFIRTFAKNSAALARLLPSVPIYGNGPRYFIEPVAFGGLVGVVLWMAVKGNSFHELLPNLTVIALASYRMLPSVQLLYAAISGIHAHSYLVGELESELAEATKMPAGQNRSVTPITFQTAIRLENITFAYEGSNRQVLRDFNLEIRKNESLGVVGATGSGKSTLVDIILGLHRPQSGVIRVDGKVLTADDLCSWRSIIGYVPQDIFLIDATVAENIAFGVPRNEIDLTAVRAAADAAQITRFIETELQDQWDTVVGERGVRLSGGQRQRIGLARALYHRPQLLLLDEATSALDSATEADVMKAINALRGSITMIVIAHRLSTIENCDSICRLGAGQMTAVEVA